MNTLTTFQPNNTFQLSDGFSKVLGAHTLKFGGEFRYLQINERNTCAPNGDFTFNGSETGSRFCRLPDRRAGQTITSAVSSFWIPAPDMAAPIFRTPTR